MIRHTIPCDRRRRLLIASPAVRQLSVAILVAVTAVAGLATPVDLNAQGRPLEILFLGHASEHHNSSAFYPLLAGPLARAGVHLTYVEDPERALNDETLRWYDGLLLYANHDSITASQESALLKFVEAGGGFIPIHSASYCFRNSDAFVSLVGAQFASHGTGTFSADVIHSDHPALAGVPPFETWDETYVHTRHASDRTILMERVDENGREPYTWTRTQGKGRVFYTAFGHDERTWSNPGFHKLVESGIVWAVGDKAANEWRKFEVPTQEYVEAALPNYEQREPNLRMQRPLSAAESQKLMHVPPMFDLQLFASEPMIVNPITMAFDERGRLWVVETNDYPNEVRDDQGGDDRIKILEDTDGDGTADKVTVFADGLNIPTSITFSNGGVIVAQAPHFLFLMDTDGDDVADVSEILMTGWSTSDTHAGPSQLQYGFDNRIWGTVGYAGFNGTVAGEPFRFGQAFYRFAPDAREMEFITNTSNNTWGLGFSEDFDVFGSTANNAPSWYLAIPDRYFRDARGLPAPLGSSGIASFYAIHPMTPNVRQVDVFGGFTAAAGHHLYTARAFPREYWNRAALINEPTGHLLAQGFLEPAGSGFVTADGGNLLSSADEWVSPIHAEVGPDGAVWVLDWYNFIVQHNPTPQGFGTGDGNAYLTDLRDHNHGRIYRIVYKDAPAYTPPALDADDPASLVAALNSDNLFWRLTAQRLLVERGRKDVAPELTELANDRSVDAVGVNGTVVNALWTLHGLGLLDGNDGNATSAALAALTHPAAGVRKAALQVLPHSDTTLTSILTADLLTDPNPRTRLTAVLAVADAPPSARAGWELYAMSRDSAVYTDPWLGQAVYLAATRHPDGFLDAWRGDDDRMRVAELPASLRADDTPAQWQETPQDEFSAWPTMDVPGVWEEKGFPKLDGWLWYIRAVEGSTGGAAELSLGMVNNDEETWVNGTRVGATEGWDVFRHYTVPQGVWKRGTNVVAVRVYDAGGTGGFHGEADSMHVVESNGRRHDLAGAWHYKIERRINTTVEYQSAGELAAHFAFNYGSEADRIGEVALDDRSATSRRGNAVPARPNARPVDRMIEIKAVRQQLAYDVTEVRLEAGTVVDIVFTNDDLLQHNVVVIKPGTIELVGAAADELARSPQGAARDYVPALSSVLASTKLVNPGESATLRFRVPDAPGEYPFVCTFPGHWRLMRGVFIVS